MAPLQQAPSSVRPSVAVCAAITIPAAEAQDPPFQAVPDVNSKHVQELGEWAVAEHVKKANDGLRFLKVVDGKFQFVLGLKYVLVIDAWNVDADSTEGTHTAVVFEEGWSNSRTLISFS